MSRYRFERTPRQFHEVIRIRTRQSRQDMRINLKNMDMKKCENMARKNIKQCNKEKATFTRKNDKYVSKNIKNYFSSSDPHHGNICIYIYINIYTYI